MSNGVSSKTVTGSNVRIIINNKIVGVCTSASWSIDFSVRPIYGIDNIIPQEIAPGSYKCSFDFAGVRILQKSLEDSGIISYPGVNAFAPYISICIQERLSNQPLLNITAAMVDSTKTSISAKGIATFDLSGIGFVALSNSNNVVNDYQGLPQQMT